MQTCKSFSKVCNNRNTPDRKQVVHRHKSLSLRYIDVTSHTFGISVRTSSSASKHNIWLFSNTEECSVPEYLWTFVVRINSIHVSTLGTHGTSDVAADQSRALSRMAPCGTPPCTHKKKFVPASLRDQWLTIALCSAVSPRTA